MLDRKTSRGKFIKQTMTSSRGFAVAIVFLCAAQFGMAQAAASKTDVERRVDSILSKMTIDEKIEIIGGINDFYTRPIPRLGIPSLRMSDGPMGVHDFVWRIEPGQDRDDHRRTPESEFAPVAASNSKFP
jgi:hypothetical protein